MKEPFSQKLEDLYFALYNEAEDRGISMLEMYNVLLGNARRGLTNLMRTRHVQDTCSPHDWEERRDTFFGNTTLLVCKKCAKIDH